jgi:hypothetical protein
MDIIWGSRGGRQFKVERRDGLRRLERAGAGSPVGMTELEKAKAGGKISAEGAESAEFAEEEKRREEKRRLPKSQAREGSSCKIRECRGVVPSGCAV